MDMKEFEDVNKVQDVRVRIIGFEICLCKGYDLSKKEDFRHVKKREILYPMNVDISLKRMYVLTGDLRSFIDKTYIDMTLSKNEMKVSFKDLGVIQMGVNYQLSQLP